MLTTNGVGFYSDIACKAFGDASMNVDEVSSSCLSICDFLINDNYK